MPAAQTQTMQVIVDMSEQDFELIQNGAKLAWPGATMSDSEVVLGLAKIAANCMSKPKKAVRP